MKLPASSTIQAVRSTFPQASASVVSAIHHAVGIPQESDSFIQCLLHTLVILTEGEHQRVPVLQLPGYTPGPVSSI
jgi:hypothetical protein